MTPTLTRRRTAPALALVATLVVAGGCGGSSGKADTTTREIDSSTPSKAAFIKQADAVCSKAQERIETEFAAFLKKSEKGNQGKVSPSEAKSLELEAIETVGVPALRQQAEEVRALGAPSGAKGEVEAYLAAIDEEVEEGERDPRALFGPAKKVFAKSLAAARRIGFKVCASQ